MYYNTTNLTNPELKIASKRTEKQSDVVLDIFERQEYPLSPSMVFDYAMNLGFEWPLTSVRRAISNLTNDGKLNKTTRKIRGIYGAKEYMWEVK